jgi:peptide/nickel transport system substrate-binding protein
MRVRGAAALALCLVLLFTLAPAPAPAAAQGTPPGAAPRNGAWLDGVAFVEEGDPYNAVARLQSGELDAYPYTVRDPALFAQVKADPSLGYVESHDLYYEITLNPAGPEFYDGRLNPFAVRPPVRR